MTTTSQDDLAAQPAAPDRTNPLAVAALASAGAGLVHAAAAGSHNTDSTVAMLFAVAAAAQFGWAAFTTLYNGRRVAIFGAALNTVMVLAWVVSRTRGWPAVDGLREVEPVGTQDLLAAILGSMAAISAAATLVRPVALRLSRVPVALTSGVLVLALAVPGMAAPHEHGGEGHEHGDDVAAGHEHEEGEEHEHAEGETVAAGHDDADHEHEDGDHADHEDGDHEDGDHADHEDHAEHADGPIISLDDPRVTAKQAKAAQALIDRTEKGMAKFTDTASVEAAGYTSIGDSVTGYEHFINVGYIADGIDLDENQIESIVFIVNDDGTKELASAMYIMGFGKTLDDVPDIAGELTKWHDHQNLCWEGARVVGTTDATGKCEQGEFMATPPMLHVWMREHPCGPFAGIEGHIGEGDCGSHDHGDKSGADTASGPIISLDDPRVTPTQAKAAQALIDRTAEGMARFTDTASVEAAGYVSIGDAVTGFEHFINVGYIGDGDDLDENKIESIVFVVNDDGTKTLGSAMYILGPGNTMDTVPDIAGDLTKWHDHQNLCWEGVRVVGTTDATGKCERGVFRGTPPMLHVWQVPHPCGPFAGLEGHIGEGDCGSHEH